MASEDEASRSLMQSHLPDANTWCLLASLQKCPLDVEQSRQLKLPSSGPITPTARNQPAPEIVIGARLLALSCESNRPIKLQLAEESLMETDLKMPGGQERDGLGTPTQGEVH